MVENRGNEAKICTNPWNRKSDSKREWWYASDCKVGWSLKKGLSAFFVCGLFHFLRAVNYQTICTSKRWDWTPLWKKIILTHEYKWVPGYDYKGKFVFFWCFCCFFSQYLCQVNTEYILYMYTLTPIAFPVVTKKRLCWLQWPKFQFH